MPLFELYRMTKERNSSPSTEPENDFVELAWENGQILTEGQSSKTRKSPLSTSLPSHNTKIRDKYVGNGTKIGEFGTEDSVLNEIPMSVPSVELGLNQDDDMVRWLNYPIDESLQHEYCSDFMPVLSGVTGNEHFSQNNSASYDKRSNSSNHFNREFIIHNDSSLECGNLLKISSLVGGEGTRPKSSAGQLYASSSLQCPTSYPYYRSRVRDSSGSSVKNSNEDATIGDSNPVSAVCLPGPGLKMQKLDPRMSTSKHGLMNFSHFTRPFALAKANLQNASPMLGSGLSRIERMGSENKSSVANSSNPVDPTPVDSGRGLRKESGSQCQSVAGPSKVDVKPLEPKPPQQRAAAEQSEVRYQDEGLKNVKKPSQVLGESATNGQLVSEKTVELVVASSSVCSGNSVERASEDYPKHNLKRKHHDTQDSEFPSEDVEEESAGVMKTVPTLVGTGSKRSRAAEVHNLSERRRRDRINEKMRALQELIPNCNKVDKASMLDEAIEHLKTLQLQVQIMSMGAGLYMPPMMFQRGMQHIHSAAHMAHYSSLVMGMGMGVGYGMAMPDINGGSSCYPMVQAPPIHGTHFPGPSFAGPAAMQGMAGSNFQLFGIHGQGQPVSMPHAPPLTPLSGGPIMKSAMGLNASGVVVPMDNLDAATGSTSKEPVQNVNSQIMQSTGTNSLVNQTSSQCQGTNEGFAQPFGVQENCQAAEVNGHGAFNSSGKNDNESTGAACYD